MRRIAFLVVIVISFLTSCKEEQQILPIETNELARYDVIILNEGNFQWGQGTVSMYNSSTSQTIHKVFQANNEQRPLGDVAQSMTIKGDTAFIVVNNSNKIEVINLNTFKSIGQIKNLNSPRNMLIINEEKAYISDLYEGKVYIVNPSNFKLIGEIITQGWTEEMVMVNEKVFICQVDKNQILVVDTQTDEIIKEIVTANSPQYIEVDKNEDVWVSCSGGLENDTAAIHRINTTSLAVEQSFYADDQHLAFLELAINNTGDELCVLSTEGIYQFSIEVEDFPIEPLIKANGRNFYSMNINPSNDEIYVCDAMDYQQQGIAYRYTRGGQEVDHFRVGIIPGAIYFK